MAADDWTYPQSGDAFTAYPYNLKFYRALQQRKCAITGDNLIWPDTSTAWRGGTITNITATQLTDSTGGFVSTFPKCPGPRWSSWHCSDFPFQVADYDVILNSGSLDETKIIKCRITSNDDTHLNFATIIDYVTAGYISSVSELIGKEYAICNSTPALWWHDRVPTFPNDKTAYAGSGEAVTVMTVTGGPLENYKDFTITFGATTVGVLESSGNTVTVSRLGTAPSGAYQIKNPAGVVIASGTVSSNEDGIRQDGQTFDVPLAGKDLMIYADGRLRRISVTGNSPTTIRFARQPYQCSGSYCVLEAGGRGFPGKVGGLGQCSFSGASRRFYTTKPHDDWTDPETVSSVSKPTAFYPWEEQKNNGEEGCEMVYTHIAIDFDAWGPAAREARVANDAECGTPDKIYSPDMHKSCNGIQTDAEAFSHAFIKPGISYVAKHEINNFSSASWMRHINVNWFEKSATATAVLDGNGNTVGATVTFTGISLPYVGAAFKYEVTDSDLDRRFAVGESGATSVTATMDKKHVGKGMKLTGAWGWTRHEPRMFKYAYPRTAFIPDVDPGDGLFAEPSVVDPPNVKDFCCEDEEEPPVECCKSCDYVGRWIKRGVSTNYMIAGGSQEDSESGQAFVTNDLARFMGDSWAGPGIHGESYGYTLIADNDLTIGYWRNLSVSKRKEDHQTLMDKVRKGQATSGGKWFLRDDTRDWWGSPFGGGTNYTHSGTATGGSGTTLVDSTLTDEMNEKRCFFDAGRFVSFSAAYQDFILEVDVPASSSSSGGSPSPTVIKVPIIGANRDTGVITFPTYCGLTITAGMTYRIKEPKWNLNWWEGRTLKVTQPDGTILTTPIVHSDKDTLFFAPLASPILPNAQYEIVELSIGGVYKWNGSKWIIPTGTDSRGDHPQFHKSVFENAPTEVVRYGRAMQYDSWYLVNVQEIFKGIDALRWTQKDFTWVGRADPAVAEYNLFVIDMGDFVGSIGCPGPGNAYQTIKDAIDEYWYGDTLGTNPYPFPGFLKGFTQFYENSCEGCDPEHPEYTGSWYSTDSKPSAVMTWANGESACDSGYHFSAFIQRSYGYPVISGMCKAFNRQIDFMIYTEPACDLDNACGEPAVDNRWDSFGDPVEENAFGLIDSLTTADAQAKGSKFGDTTPQWPKPNDLAYPRCSMCCYQFSWWETPVIPESCRDSRGGTLEYCGSFGTGGCRGYDIKRSTGILKWDVAGGFTHVT